MAKINREIKNQAHARAKGRCEQCGHRGSRANWELHVHHLTYERLGNELLEDVIVLCLECHGKIHPRHTLLTKKEQQERKKLAKKASSRYRAKVDRRKKSKKKKKRKMRAGTYVREDCPRCASRVARNTDEGLVCAGCGDGGPVPVPQSTSDSKKARENLKKQAAKVAAKIDRRYDRRATAF